MRENAFTINNTPLNIQKKDEVYNFSKVFGDSILELALTNKFNCITAAMKNGTGLDRFSKLYKDRYIDVGIAEIKSRLDEEFGITDALRFPYGKALGETSFNLSYRYFLLFNSLTESIIGTSETFFDTTFYGKEEYDKAISHIFDLVINCFVTRPKKPTTFLPDF